MTIKEVINERLKTVSAAESYSRKRLENSPDGILSLRTERGVLRYYQRSGSETNGMYITDRALIRALEEKLYYTKLLKAVQGEKEALLKIKTLLESIKPYETVFLEMPIQKRHLIGPYEPELDDIEKTSVKKSWNANAGRKALKPGEGYLTRNGERVRSKSELIIADRLKDAGVPYHYENEFMYVDETLGQFVTWHPDFEVLNTRTGQKFYWEHFGLMDNQSYCAQSLNKLEIYAENGIFAGENLIITMESSTHKLNTEYIDLIISEYLK